MSSLVHALIYSSLALFYLTVVGNIACRYLFDFTGLRAARQDDASEPNGAAPAGWIIGWLERLVLAIGVLTSSWEVLAAVIALKTVARFKELDDQIFAEYFLVGSLFSILWTVIVVTVWVGYDVNFGSNLQGQLLGIVQEVSD
ncbi:MAG: hypothetical protein ACSHXW_16640 [Yoonia sp.]